MKRLLSAMLQLTITTCVLAIVIGCEGPGGPAGQDGVNGEDGVANCIQCHTSSTDLYAKIIQYQASTHFTGGNFERNGTSCAHCHTHEGFMALITTDTMVTVSVPNPTPPNCRTCHNIHTNYDTTDYALTTSTPVTLFQGGVAINIGKGNMCAQCHQGRTVSPIPSAQTIITSTRYGVHHGPQANVFSGIGLYNLVGSTPYPVANSMGSTITDACVTCHMAAPYGTQAGGHTFNSSYEYHENDIMNTAGCLANCHAEGEDAHAVKIEALTVEIDSLIDNLKTVLVAKTLIDTNDYAVKCTTDAISASAIVNYKAILEDRSHGIHNPGYVRALLKNTLELVQQ